MAFLRAMCGLADGDGLVPLGRYLTPEVWIALSAGVLFSTPVLTWLKDRGQKYVLQTGTRWGNALALTGWVAESCAVVALLALSAAWLASGTYNPFIYFRF